MIKFEEKYTNEMQNSFDMACRDNNSTLRLNLKGNPKEPHCESKIPSPSFKHALNSESIMASPRKYNVSSLRIPADPSWPKIPQRRFADSVGDIIDQPCVVTVTGTPRSRTIVRAPNSQIIKGTTSRETLDSTFYGSNSISISQTMSQPLRRRPGCIDPRFKRVTTVKSQMKSTELQEHEHEVPTEMSRSAHVIPNQIKSRSEKMEHSIPEKDTNVQQVTQQEAEKPNEAKRSEIGIQAMVKEEERKELTKIQTDFINSENCKNQQTEKNHLQNVTGEIVKFQNRDVYEMSQQKKCDLLCKDCKLSQDRCCEETKKFSCRNENRVQEKSEETVSNKVSPCQCCDVKVSALESSKRHEIESNDNQCKSTRKDLSPENNKNSTFKFSSDSKGIFQEKDVFEKGKRISDKRIESQCLCKKGENFHMRQITPKHEITHHKCTGRFKTFIKSTAHVEDQIQSEASISLSEDEIYRNRCKEHIMDDKESFFPATSESEYVENEKIDVLNRKQKLIDYYNSAGEESNYLAKDYELIDFFQTHDGFYNFDKKIDFSENEEKSSREKKGRETENAKFRQKMKSEQNLSRGVFQGRKFSPNSEPHITIKQRRCATSYSKKISEYSQGKPEMTDSEFTFLWPERQRARRKSNHGYSQKLIEERRNRSCDSKRRNNSERIHNGESHFDSNKHNQVYVPHPTDLQESKRTSCKKLYQAPPQHLNLSVAEIMKNQNILQINSPRADTDIATEKPTKIPIKTQQLLSKSYWEYYTKLNQENEGEDPQKQYFCQVAMGAPQIKKKRGDVKNYEDQSELSPPELRTLERCSVLSSMINKTLDPSIQQSTDTLQTKQLFMNANMKSSSDPTAGTLSGVINQVQSGSPLDMYEGSSISSKSGDKRKDAQVNNRLVKLKTIVFFGILMYLIIILLPMVYDYFFYEEYDEYADLTYVELALDYVVSSFREAFDGVFDLVNRILFRPFFVVFSAHVGSVTALLKFILSIILPFRS